MSMETPSFMCWGLGQSQLLAQLKVEVILKENSHSQVYYNILPEMFSLGKLYCQ